MKYRVSTRTLRDIPEQSSANTGVNLRSSTSDDYSVRAGWGRVLRVRGNSVDVEMETGIEIRSVPVASPTWVVPDSGVIAGTKSVPPVGSKVLVLILGSVEESIVIGSGFDEYEQSHRARFPEGEEAIASTVLPGGWEITYDRETGNWTMTNSSGVTIEIDDENDEISVTIGSNTLKITDSQFELGGNTKSFVTHGELDSALQTFLTALNAHVHSGVSTGGGTSGPLVSPLVLDISLAESAKAKTG